LYLAGAGNLPDLVAGSSGGGGAVTPGVEGGRSFGERLLGAIRLEADVFKEVEHDEAAMLQAAGVVVLAALARGLGLAAVGGGLFSGVLGGILGWFVGSALIWFVGVRWFEHESDYPEILRTLGFASAPQLLLVAGVLPIGPLRGILALVVAVWSIAAWVVAVREALDVETSRAISVCLLAFLLQVLLALAFAAIGLR
jgi:hypothetical protein